MADNTVSVDVELAIKKAQADLDKLSGRFDTFANKVEKSLGGVDKAFGSLKLAIGAAAATLSAVGVAAVTRFAASMVNDGIKAAQGYEDALNSFNVALQLSGNYSAAASKDFEEFASAIQQTTKYSDDATLSAGALIANISGLGGEPLKRATQNALDLSAALKIDLQTAAQLVGKAAAGETGTLSRYGIIIGETGTKAEKAARALELIQSKFGGAAVKDAQTYTGATTQLGNAYGDLQKEIGKVVTQNPTLIAAVNGASKFLLQLADRVQNSSGALKGDFAQAIVVAVRGLGVLLDIGDGAVRFFTAIWRTLIVGADLFVSYWMLKLSLVVTALEKTMGKAIAVVTGNNPFEALAQGMRQQNLDNFFGLVDGVKGIGEAFSQRGIMGEAAEGAYNFANSLTAIGTAAQASAEQTQAAYDKTWANEADLQQKAAEARAKGAAADKAAWDAKISGTQKALGTIAGLQTSSNRELFMIGKAAAISTATINTFQGVSEAWKLGPLLGPILAPLVAIAGAAQIAGIAAQGPGFATGGIVGGNSTSGDRVPIRVNSREAVLTLDQQQNLFNAINAGNLGGGQGVVVNVEGNVIVDSPSRIDEFIERINERVKFGNTPLYASAVV